MAKKSITWLEFLALENRLHSTFRMCKERVPNSKITTYSLSDNTLWKHWIKDDPDGIYRNDLFIEHDLLSRSTIKISSGLGEGCYVEIDIYSDGKIGCSAHLVLPDKLNDSDSTRLLSKTNETEVMVPFGEHKELFQTVFTSFRIMEESLNRPTQKFFNTLETDDRESIKKYLIGKKN